MVAIDRCPLTQTAGVFLSEREPDELFRCYERSFGSALPTAFRERYFREVVREFQSGESGLRWYSPGIVGEADFYQVLGEIYPWYYRDSAWDKDVVCQVLRDNRIGCFCDYGCGNGALLKQARALGIDGWGIDINQRALAHARAAGLSVYHLEEIPANHPSASVLVILQTIEHVLNPLQFLQDILARVDVQVLLLSAPTHESLLGHMRDPLSWPPHHMTMWSARAFETLAGLLGFKVSGVVSEPLTLERCRGMLQMEGSLEVRGLPPFPNDEHALANCLDRARARAAPWALYSHSIIAVLERKQGGKRLSAYDQI